MNNNNTKYVNVVDGFRLQQNQRKYTTSRKILYGRNVAEYGQTQQQQQQQNSVSE